MLPAGRRVGRSAYIDEGIRLFNAGEYFLAHETLEEHWVEAPQEERDFLQGLIHLAIGFHHFERGNSKGARLQFQKGLNRLASYSGEHDGIDVEELRAFLTRVPSMIEEGAVLERPILR